MKILVLILILSLTSCSDDGNKKQVTDITGTWELIETYSSSVGGDPQWAIVENGYIYTFFSDGTFNSTRFSECTTGEYTITETQLTLNYDCEYFSTGIENPPGTFIENYIFEDGKVILTPTYMNCDEGCGYKFYKVE